MRIGSTAFSRYRLLIAQCVLVFCVIVLPTGLQNRSVCAQDQSSDPVISEVGDLGSWRARNGRTLFDVMKQHSLAMLVLIDPDCGTCTKAKDSLRGLRDRVEEANIKYFVLMIPSGSEASKYFAYADSLKLDAETFIWSNAAAKPPTLLTTMEAPSHLMLTSEGRITEKWAGIPSKF